MTIEAPLLPLVDTLAGVFTFTRDGKEETANFLVRCEPRPSITDPYFAEIMDRRVDAYNLQYMEACNTLRDCTNVHFAETKPDPFF
jgi:hypothetical protein